jgi:FHA domain-containing protein
MPPPLPKSGTPSLPTAPIGLEAPIPGTKSGAAVPPPLPGSEAELAVIRFRVVAKAREVAVAQASASIRRHSPTAHIIPEERIMLELDLGELIHPEQYKGGKIKIPFSIDPDRNILFLDPKTLQDLKGMVTTDPRIRAVQEALLSLERIDIMERPELAPALAAGEMNPDVQVLPATDTEILKANREKLDEAMHHWIKMTFMGPLGGGVLKNAYLVGRLTLDAQGRILGTEIARPDHESPRGTHYTQGMQGAGDTLDVIITGDSIVHHDSLQHLNKEQQSAILALAESSQAILAEDPYAVDVILHRGIGPLALDLGREVSKVYQSLSRGSTILNLTIVRQADGTLGLRKEWREDKGGTETKVGLIKLNLSPSSKFDMSRPVPIRLGEFKYEFSADVFNALEIGKLLEHFRNLYSPEKGPVEQTQEPSGFSGLDEASPFAMTAQGVFVTLPKDVSNIELGRHESEGIYFDTDSYPPVLRFPDPNVSFRHAEINKVGENFYIMDLDSTNGTYLIGEKGDHEKLKPSERVLIQLGQRIFLGRGASFVFNGQKK